MCTFANICQPAWNNTATFGGAEHDCHLLTFGGMIYDQLKNKHLEIRGVVSDAATAPVSGAPGTSGFRLAIG